MNNKEKRWYRKCSAARCLNTTFNSDVTFFSFPSDQEKRSVWLKILQRQDLEGSTSWHHRVCEQHFDCNSVILTPTRKILKKHAMPGPPQHEMAVANSRKIKKVLTDSEQIDRFLSLCDKYLCKNLARIVRASRINHYDVRNRYSIGFKLLCLNLYHVSPEAYNLLRDSLSLPYTSSLLRMCEPVVARPSHIMEALKIKATRMKDRDKCCSVFVDAIKLKQNLLYHPKEDLIFGFHHEGSDRPLGYAEYGLVAVVQGICGDYRQLASYHMMGPEPDAERVARWTDQLIAQLCAAGFDVRLLIPGSSYPFLNSAKIRNVSPLSPHFYVNDKKIYYMFDPARLIVDIRDNLIAYDFHFNNSVAKWSDIRQFYDKDSVQKLRIAPKLTEWHVEPPEAQQSHVPLAAQVFGAPVAAGMLAYTSLGALDTSAEGTIDLIAKINDLIQFFNLSSQYDCPSHRNDFWNQVHKVYFINSMITFFKTLNIIDERNGIDVTSLATFIESFRITLKATLHLYEDLKMNSFTYILTRKFNRDYIDKFLDDVKTDYENEPMSWQLINKFRKSYLAEFLKPRKRSEGPNKDMSGLLDQKEKSRKTNVPSVSSEKKPKGDSPYTVNQQRQDLAGMSTSKDSQDITLEDIISLHTVKPEHKMEVDDDIINQIKQEEEDFLNMYIKIENHEIKTSSRHQDNNEVLSKIKQKKDDSVTNHSQCLELKVEEKITPQKIKREPGDFLNLNFQMEENELIISEEGEHNYESTFIKQEPVDIIGDGPALVGNKMLDNVSNQITTGEITKPSTSNEENTNRSFQSIKGDQANITSEDFSEEDNESLMHPESPHKLELDDILAMVFTIDEQRKKKPYQRCKQPIRLSDYKNLNLPNKNVLVYISSWLLQRCQFWHKNCGDLITYVQVDLAQTSNETQYSRYIDYRKSNGNLPVTGFIPSDDFVKYVEAMDAVFRGLFKMPQIHTCNILASLLASHSATLKNVNFVLPCACFPVDYARQLFFRIRLEYTLEYSNQHTNKPFKVFRFDGTPSIITSETSNK